MWLYGSPENCGSHRQILINKWKRRLIKSDLNLLSGIIRGWREDTIRYSITISYLFEYIIGHIFDANPYKLKIFSCFQFDVETEAMNNGWPDGSPLLWKVFIIVCLRKEVFINCITCTSGTSVNEPVFGLLAVIIVTMLTMDLYFSEYK